METLKYKAKMNSIEIPQFLIGDNIDKDPSYFEKRAIFEYGEVKEFLTKFHESYWEESHEGDKFKRYISCDDLDFLMDKYFGDIVDIKTLQILPNKDK